MSDYLFIYFLVVFDYLDLSMPETRIPFQLHESVNFFSTQAGWGWVSVIWTQSGCIVILLHDHEILLEEDKLALWPLYRILGQSYTEEVRSSPGSS